MTRSRYCAKGSPPPMRGKGNRSGICFRFCRITPAYAGKRIERADHSRYGWDHPRLCGEKPLPVQDGERRKGSPPPMRGKVLLRHRIPVVFEDHPRLCGEKPRRYQRHGQSEGSPPPMRGKAASWQNDHSKPGITPAYAGKSNTAFNHDGAAEDHPRLCGEKFWAAVMPSMLEGSPPPMRGKAQLTVFSLCAIRITPAYAGKSIFTPWGWAGA